jgi:large subunit ribosomal protein L30
MPETKSAAGKSAPKSAPGKTVRKVARKKAASKTITIQQVRSGICANYRHKRTLKALGLRRPQQKVVRPDNPAVRGMVNTIPYLVRIVES